MEREAKANLPALLRDNPGMVQMEMRMRVEEFVLKHSAPVETLHSQSDSDTAKPPKEKLLQSNPVQLSSGLQFSNDGSKRQQKREEQGEKLKTQAAILREQAGQESAEKERATAIRQRQEDLLSSLSDAELEELEQAAIKSLPPSARMSVNVISDKMCEKVEEWVKNRGVHNPACAANNPVADTLPGTP